MTKLLFNFSAGPAMIPATVLQTMQQELRDWRGLGISVMELNHRSNDFIAFAQETEQNLRDLLTLPTHYKVLFCHGGARGQFAALPLNLLAAHDQADYVDTGYWSSLAFTEARKYCAAQQINAYAVRGKMRVILPMAEWRVSQHAKLLHYCANETADGITVDESPIWQDRIVAADFSSSLLSRPLDVSRFGVVYACAQKNIGIAGITLVIVREDLLGRGRDIVPTVLDYTALAQQNSVVNTPPVFAWYCCGLMLQWIKQQGGLDAVAVNNRKKAAYLYHFIDQHPFYSNRIHPDHRSLMNVTFQLPQQELERLFIREAEEFGLLGIKGHQAVGGIRVSLYNAMPFTGVQALTEFMADFEQRYQTVTTDVISQGM